MRAALKNFYDDVARKKEYWLPVVLFAVIAYGFSMTNRTISVDDLLDELYFGSGNVMIKGTRWALTVYSHILSIPIFTPFVNKFLGVCFMIFGAVVLSCAGHYLLGARLKNPWPYAVFSSAMVTYPLINEIFEYNIANLTIGFNIFLASVALLFQVTYKGKPLKRVLISAVVLTFVVSAYESCVFVYVSAVCIYLFCKYALKNEKCARLQWLKEGIGYAVPLAVAVMLRIVIGLSWMKLLGLSYVPNGKTYILWGAKSLSKIFEHLIRDTANLYVFNTLIYFPLTIFLIAAILFFVGIIVLAVRQKRAMPVILGVVVMVSLFSQSILQGVTMPYRTAQTIGLFVAFVAAAVVGFGVVAKHSGVKIGTILLGLLLCLHQGIYLNQIFALNNQRFDNEAALVQQIGYELKTEYDDKTVVFVGTYDIGEWISSQISVDTDTLGGKLYEKIRLITNPNNNVDGTEFVQNNVNSLLNSVEKAAGSQRYMKELFSYCGYDIDVLDEFPDEVKERYERIAVREGLKPFEIRDMGGYIMVCLGEIELSE